MPFYGSGPFFLILIVVLGGPLLLLLLIGALIGGKKGASWAVAIFCAGIIAFLVRSDIEDSARRREAQKRAATVEVCRSELPAIAATYTADSVLIESGIVEADDLQHLLSRQGLRFVEFKAGALHDRAGKENGWGFTIRSGNDSTAYSVGDRSPYARVSLSSKTDPYCSRKTYPLDFSRPSAPFSPDACLRIESVKESTAELALRAIPVQTAANRIQWVLAIQDSGNVLAALTSSDNPRRPAREPDGDSHSIPVAFGKLSCFGAHDGLLKTLNGRRPLPLPYLALVSRNVEAEQSEHSDGRFTWHDVWVNEQLAPGWSGNTDPRYHQATVYGPDWEQAYRNAESIGWATVGDRLLDYRSGELLRLAADPYERSVAFGKGFMRAKSPPDGKKDDSVLLTRYSPDGRIQWRGVIHPEVSHEDEIGSFEPSAIFWDGLEVRIVGLRRRRSESRSESWEFIIPRSSIGLDG